MSGENTDIYYRKGNLERPNLEMGEGEGGNFSSPTPL